MEKVLFRTEDILLTKMNRETCMEYFVQQAEKSGLTILEKDVDHIKMLGYKWNFLKYYIRSAKVSVQLGQKLSNELKRIISVLFWR